jgi:ribosomal protein L39E
MENATLSPLARLYVLLCIPHIWLVGKFWFVCEDAFITFRYSRNLANGLGARYNLGEHSPVEGYSNFLWMLIAAFFEFIGMDVTFWMPLISAACGLCLLWLILHTLHERLGMSLLVTGLAGAVYALFVPAAVWTTGGLATMPQSLLMFSSFVWLAYAQNRREAIIAGLLALTLAWIRTEGIEWGIVIAGCASVSRYQRGYDLKRPLATFFGILLVGYGVYFAWRYNYYHSILSNTAHAKVDLSSESLARGIQYVSYYGILMLSPLVLIPAAAVASLGRRRADGVGFAALAIGVPTYALVISGDYMAFFRMMVPGVAFMSVSFGFLYDGMLRRYEGQLPAISTAAVAVAILGVLPGYDVILVPEQLLNAVQTRLIATESLEKDLALQGLEIADRNDYLFGFGESFYIRRGRNEMKRWERMHNNPIRWKADAEGLMQVVQPTDRLVTGAIGALGYFTNLYIYDQHGLIDGAVSQRREREQLRWPGHDKYVRKTYFLRKNPEILEYQVVFGEEAAVKIAIAGYEFDKPAPREWYYPDVTQVQVNGLEEPVYVVLQRRAESPEAARRGWRRFDEDWGAVLAQLVRKTGRGKSAPPWVVQALGGRWRTYTKENSLEEEELAELVRLEMMDDVNALVSATSEKRGVQMGAVQNHAAPGHMLYTSGHRPVAMLTDLAGQMKHRWSFKFSDVWSGFPVEKDHPGRRYWRRAYLLPEGELLALYEGLGLIKLDKHSKLIWKRANRAHHALDLTEDGEIYILTRLARLLTRNGQQRPFLEDSVTVISANGSEKFAVSILDALEASDFQDLIAEVELKDELLVANSIQVLDGSFAERLPQFKQGNVLLSLPNLSTLVVLDMEQQKIVWAATGDFELQHDAKMLPNGHLLMFDGRPDQGARALEIDPLTMETVWSFEGVETRSVSSQSSGLVDRLPNGNTLVVNSNGGHAAEVNSTGVKVWEFLNPHRVGDDDEFVATLLQADRLESAPLGWLAELEPWTPNRGEGEKHRSTKEKNAKKEKTK